MNHLTAIIVLDNILPLKHRTHIMDHAVTAYASLAPREPPSASFAIAFDPRGSRA